MNDLDWTPVAEMLGWERVLGLAEVMDFPGVVAGDPELTEYVRQLKRRDFAQ